MAIQLIPDLPDQILGARAVGEVEDDDYEDVLVPALEDRLSRHENVRFLYLLGEDFERYEADAVWEDAKLGVAHFTSFERIAIVTDLKWMRRSIKVFGWMIPGEMRHYPLADLAQARGWLMEGIAIEAGSGR
jgi:hypothetical protein